MEIAIHFSGRNPSTTMIAAACRTTRTAMLLVVLAATLSAQVMEFGTAIAAGSPQAGEGATFLSVAAVADAANGAPPRAFPAGYFTGILLFGNETILSNQDGEDGLLAAVTQDPQTTDWNVDWLLTAEGNNGDARFTDVAPGPNGNIYVTGTYTGEVVFQRPQLGAIVFNSAAPSGFVAWASPDGEWLDAFEVFELEPKSLVLDPDGSIYVAGRPQLARRYDQVGNVEWNEDELPDTITIDHLAFGTGPKGRMLYITGTNDIGEGADVFLAQVNADGGGINWVTQVTSPAEEQAGGVGVGPQGEVRLAFSSEDPEVQYEGEQQWDPPNSPARHAYVLRINDEGLLRWGTLLAEAFGGDEQMVPRDLAVDPFGNSHIAISFTLDYLFEDVVFTGNEDAGVITVDARGVAYNFDRSTGDPVDTGFGVAAPNRSLQVLVGSYAGQGDSTFGNNNGLPAVADPRGFFATLEPDPSQEAYIVTDPAGGSVEEISSIINSLGGQVYRTLDNQQTTGVLFVAAFVTDEAIQDLAGLLDVRPDLPLAEDGMVSDAGWALASLNDAFRPPPYHYTYPETCEEVVLYLIDTGYDNTGGHFNANPNLRLSGRTVVYGVGDPDFSTSVDHGTKMLSMIAGPTRGVAQGTPVTVVNYDIYPAGTSRLSTLVEAVSLANTHKELTHPYTPAVTCIASSATSMSAGDPSLEPTIEATLQFPVRTTVVLSAGNTTGDAGDYAPSYLGNSKGVICAGAIRQDRTQLGGTRGGAAVDLWAPGQSVPAFGPGGAATLVNGTSAAAALTTGAALTYLSGNPHAAPSLVEEALAASYHQEGAAVGPLASVPGAGVPRFTNYSHWASWFVLGNPDGGANGDGDPWLNRDEYYWGLDPTRIDNGGASLVDVSWVPGAFSYEFKVACHLYDPALLTASPPLRLRDGSPLVVQRSTDLTSWSDATAAVTFSEVQTSNGQVTLRFDYSASSPPCYFRVKFGP